MQSKYVIEKDYGDEIKFPNGICVKICYGTTIFPRPFWHENRLMGDSRKSVIYDSDGKVVEECIDKNIYFDMDLKYSFEEKPSFRFNKD